MGMRFDIEIFCMGCGNAIESNLTRQGDQRVLTISVKPCERCVETFVKSIINKIVDDFIKKQKEEKE
jgi:hypothetical protein